VAATFARWRDAMQRARAAAPVAVAPTAANAWLYLFVRSGGQVLWVVHARAAGLAAAVDPASLTGVLPGQQEQFDRRINELAEGGGHDVFCAFVAGASALEPLLDAWIPEYRLVPFVGVMVDGNDLDPI